jgi:hypothetical protein
MESLSGRVKKIYGSDIMLLDMAAEMLAKIEKEFHEAAPEEKERFMKASLSLFHVIMRDTEKII